MSRKKRFFALHVAVLLLFPLYAKAQINFWDYGFNIATVNTSYLTRYIGTTINPISYSNTCLFPANSTINPGICAPNRPTTWPSGDVREFWRMD